MSNDVKIITLSDRQLCDVEMILNGGFAPLKGFFDKADYNSVVDRARLNDGALWPVPICLDISADMAESLQQGDTVQLRDSEYIHIADLVVGDLWRPDKRKEAQSVFGTTDEYHPGVNHLLNQTGEYYVGGELSLVSMPSHYDFKPLRYSAKNLKEQFERKGWKRIIAFQTRNPMHKAHYELTKKAAQKVQANLLINPVVGMTKPGDVDYYTRVRCYERVIGKYPEQTTMLALLNLAMRMAGPKEALWHALIRKNHGCTHFIVGRDHAGVSDADGNAYYGPTEAIEYSKQFESEIGIEIVDFEALQYVPSKGEYLEKSEIADGEEVMDLSGTEFRRRLQNDISIPEWFSFPEVVDELKKSYPPKNKKGFTVFFTGLSGSGKSTVANALRIKLLELGDRKVTLLDGDVVRTNLSSELTFSKEHRDLNIQRIGYVASEISQHNGICICAPIAPYDATRKAVRSMIEGKSGSCFLIHVSTPIEVCEQRDRKGLYKLAREGKLKGFTGIDDPYEIPEDADMVLDTSTISPDEAAHQIILMLDSEGYV